MRDLRQAGIAADVVGQQVVMPGGMDAAHDHRKGMVLVVGALGDQAPLNGIAVAELGGHDGLIAAPTH